MNTIAKLGCLNLRINEKENYSFSIRGQQFLCLNKRWIEIGTGAAVVASILRDFNNRVAVMDPVNAKMAFVFDYIAPIGFGLCSFVKFADYKGLSWLLFGSALFNNRPAYLNETEMEILFWSACSMSAIIGRGITQAMCLNTLLVSSSLLINQYGSQSINKMLKHFNDWQNTSVSGILDIKDNLKYQFSLLGKDVLCLNKTLLNAYFVLGCILTFSYDLENKNFMRYNPGLLRTSSMIAGVCAIRAIFKNYSEYAVFILAIASINSLLLKTLCQVLLLEIGAGMIYGGTGLIVFALIAYLTKKLGNKQAIQILNYLKDKKREKEYTQDIENQRKILENRKEEIKELNKKKHNASEKSNAITTETAHTQAPKKKKRIKKINDSTDNNEDKGKDKDKSSIKSLSIKKTPPVEIKKEYTTNLTGKKLTTWNQLFEITKSKPDHLVISATEIKKLIGALSGTIEKSGKRYHIYFNNKNLGHYEITHGTDKAKLLTSGYAQNVKKAIEKALDSGYISENLVKVKNGS